MRKVFGIIGAAILGGIVTLGGYKLLIEKPQVVVEQATTPNMQMVNANYNPEVINTSIAPTDFTEAAEKTVHAVVHVKNTNTKSSVNSLSDLFYGGVPRAQVGTGSGVIISPDGYIVSNNHVIANANDLEITLNNKKKYKAELIATDEKNDIALLKIEAGFDLPYIPFANSDNVKIGEWVLAVGNPYNLNSTVTAGIVSAKGRDLEGNRNIDAFIQTDAAVNPGNSGGALVNIRGELIGINTAITSKTGSFIGYSFAVPSNIARKVIDDLLEFGNVQEAILGINVDGSSSANDIEGVKIASVTDDGGAKSAGILDGDVIVKVNNVKISKFSELTGQLKAKRPGDFVEITIDRNGTELIKQVKLSKKDTYYSQGFGVQLKDLTEKEKKEKGISYGAKIVDASNSKGFTYFNVGKGYILTKINNIKVNSASEAVSILDKYTGNQHFYLETINPKGELERYRF
ncbi:MULTISPECIES: S1C family serine protease [Tenacibaculum]|uniref:S1C family serine protease n=1 Tax=Tenacibaculum TaxID=104267 RepID=UPI001F0B6578|nr:MULTISPECIES: trypsin-like peptidase domain-containing protein [Tenacibaculum]MCH3882535.1 trypsin-like peptidase domain-containing protein [Tenacibaculum aquimarinum]MDO6599979.1 trypsin-like peptidase domain-containing protein [Tenacibaculum sp. 1_MG-2023]